VSPRAIARLLLAWAAATLVLAVGACAHFSVRRSGVARGPRIASVWKAGALVARSERGEADPAIVAAVAAGGTLVVEEVIDEGPLLELDPLLRAMSVVPTRDGVVVDFQGKRTWVTPEELMARQLWDRAQPLSGLDVGIGLDLDRALGIAAGHLGEPSIIVRSEATIRRFSSRRVTPPPTSERPPPASIDAAMLRRSALEGARYLARQVGADGRFRYEVDAITDREVPGYSWPRHAGATLLLAQVAGRTRDPAVLDAAKRAAALMRGAALGRCGPHVCVGEGDLVDLGSTAIGVIAMTELVERDVAPELASELPKLTEFLRAMQRPDGEMLHYWVRSHDAPGPWHVAYYTGEAALALSRAARVTGDARDLQASARALDALVHRTFRFFGDRYWWAEEHWTCQAMADLWTRAPSRDALEFCLRWMEYNRALEYRDGETLFDAPGGYGMGTFVLPRFTAVGSRNEAGAATLRVAIAASVDRSARDALDAQLRRGFSLLLGAQFSPGATHLFAHPDAVRGAFPASPVDWRLRIDYPQHAGSGMLTYADLLDGVPLR
jgi:hypothetical protein